VRTAIVIPARYASTRLPAKPLLRETGKYLIQHVYEQALQARTVNQVVVATDDPRIVAAVQSFGGEVCMTRRDHPTGTDRVAEAARQLDADIVINLQGDEPLIDPVVLDALPKLLERNPATDVATLAVPINDEMTWRNPNVVKVVCRDDGSALYFSRSAIPYVRDARPDFTTAPQRFLQHLGLYAYRRSFLENLAEMSATDLERHEKLEQLRWLEHGHRVAVGVVAHAGGAGVDTPEDYERFVRAWRSRPQIAA
jgi:3-deoxy-manno-octulosonate cytidylyltransferase (CMP-KDO synthetase)